MPEEPKVDPVFKHSKAIYDLFDCDFGPDGKRTLLNEVGGVIKTSQQEILQRVLDEIPREKKVKSCPGCKSELTYKIATGELVWTDDSLQRSPELDEICVCSQCNFRFDAHQKNVWENHNRVVKELRATTLTIAKSEGIELKDN